MSLFYFLIPVFNFLPLYLVGFFFLFILKFSKTEEDRTIGHKWFLLALLLIPIIIAFLTAILFDLSNSIYGGSFNPSMELLTWIFFRTVILANPIPFIILFSCFLYVFFDEYIPIKYKIYLFVLVLLMTSILALGIGIFLFPESMAYLQASESLRIDLINLTLTVGMNILIFVVYLMAIPFPNSSTKTKKIQLPYIKTISFLFDIKLFNYFKNAFYVVAIVTSGLYFTFSTFFDSGMAIFLGREFFFIPVIIIIVLLIGYSFFIFFKMVGKQKNNLKYISIFIVLIILLIPSTMSYGDKLREISSAETALEDVKISSNPIKDYPINLEEIRLVDRELAMDIADTIKLPEPPKSYRVNVIDEYEEIGIINGEASWVVPIRYNEIIGNPETNYIAGYIAINLDNPIPEDSIVKYEEMVIGPSLNGYRNIKWVIQQEHPTNVIGNIYLVDPWLDTNRPAWVVILDKFTPWGVRESEKIFVVQADGKTHTYSRQEALNLGLFQINSDLAIKSVIDHATAYLRGDHIDPSSRGYLWLPASPDVQNTIGGDFFSEESSFYFDVHHFLMPNHVIGRERYMNVKTGTKESIVVWTAVNTSLTYYDFRSYSKGGISGVNSPTQAFENLQQISSSAGYANYVVRYPKLYKIENLIGNNTLLIWASIVVEQRSGADRFAGMAFVDAANTRFSKFLTAQLGETPVTFKSRFKDAINQTYLGFVGENDTIGGETITKTFTNVSVIGKEWALLQPNNVYANILLIKESNNAESFIIVTENSVATKNDFYVASVVKPGDRINIDVRWDSESQGWLAIKVSFV
jgi:hypothetical protein